MSVGENTETGAAGNIVADRGCGAVIWTRTCVGSGAETKLKANVGFGANSWVGGESDSEEVGTAKPGPGRKT